MAATQIHPGFIHYKVGCCPVGAATSSRPFLLPTPHSPVGAPICSRPFLFQLHNIQLEPQLEAVHFSSQLPPPVSLLVLDLHSAKWGHLLLTRRILCLTWQKLVKPKPTSHLTMGCILVRVFLEHHQNRASYLVRQVWLHALKLVNDCILGAILELQIMMDRVGEEMQVQIAK